MNSEEFTKWVFGNQKAGTRIYCLEGSGDTGLYMTKTEYSDGRHTHYRSPVYHAWIGGKSVNTGTDYKEIQQLYERKIHDRNNK